MLALLIVKTSVRLVVPFYH